MILLEKMSRAMEPDLWRQIDQNNAGSKVYRTAALNRAAEGVKAIREPSEAMVRVGVKIGMETSLGGDYRWPDYVSDKFIAMIDAMLNEQA